MRQRPSSWFVVVASIAAAAACGRGPSVKNPQLPGMDDPFLGGNEPDRAELEADLATTIRESYRAQSGGFEEAYLDGLARDKRLVLIDVGPDDVVIGYDPVACWARRQFSEREVEIVSKALHVGLSADGTVGWSYDELSYRVMHRGRKVIIPLRSTAVYERRAGRWLMVLEHVSYGIPDEDAFADAAAGRAVTPAALGDFTAPGREAAEVRDILERLIADTDDARVHHVSADEDVVILGSDPDREIRGALVADFATVRALYGYDATVGLGDLRVKSSTTGQVVWAAGNLVVRGTWRDQEAVLPVRATWVVEKRGEAWQVVQMHVSVPVTRAALSERVFGEAEPDVAARRGE